MSNLTPEQREQLQRIEDEYQRQRMEMIKQFHQERDTVIDRVRRKEDLQREYMQLSRDHASGAIGNAAFDEQRKALETQLGEVSDE